MTTKGSYGGSDNDGGAGFVMGIFLLLLIFGVIGISFKACSVHDKAVIKKEPGDAR